MKIALITASPKKTNSASQVILNDLKTLFSEKETIKDFIINTPVTNETIINELYEYDTWVFSFPLYVDGLPSHLLNMLCEIEKHNINNKEIFVCAISNSGFFEGIQNKNALDIMKNFCSKNNFIWGMGIGMGAGGALVGMAGIPVGRGPKKNIGIAQKELVNVITTKTTRENIYTSLSFPRILYKLLAEFGWRSGIKANGLKKKDLYKKIKN